MQLLNSLEQHSIVRHLIPVLVPIRAATKMYENSNKFHQLQMEFGSKLNEVWNWCDPGEFTSGLVLFRFQNFKIINIYSSIWELKNHNQMAGTISRWWNLECLQFLYDSPFKTNYHLYVPWGLKVLSFCKLVVQLTDCKWI